ncbi:hypothetical protein BH24DEI2_BH24DEI2_03190 [soil metagenome]
MTGLQVGVHDETLRIIAQALVGRFGQRYADDWLAKKKLENEEGQVPARAKPVEAARKPRRSAPKVYVSPEAGEEALRAAEKLIGPVWKAELGRAYPLVLVTVKAALEAGIAPTGRETNSYHCLTTIPTLTVLSSALLGRDTCFNQRTVERWLSPRAAHAAALRCWLGWKTWFTSTYRDYATGEARCTPGGTVFRVYLKPLKLPAAGRLPAIYPLADHMARDWRDLEADRHSGRTLGRTYQRAEHASKRVSPSNVGIETKSNKDACASIGTVWEDLSNAPDRGEAQLSQQYYVYPDTRSVEGATLLRNDVDRYATWLAKLVSGQETVAPVINRYREAVWVAVKAEL